MAPHELRGVAQVTLKRPVRDEVRLRGRGNARKPWSALAVDKVGDLACHLADTAGDLWRAFEPTVPRDLLDEYLALSETLVRMEIAGIPVDAHDPGDTVQEG